MVLFPNPASDEIQLVLDESLIIESVQVMSTEGQLVLEGKSNVIKINTLAPGTCLVKVETTSGNWIGRFLKTVE